MNRVEVRAEEVPLPAWTAELIKFTVKILDFLEKQNWDLSVLLCDDPYIRSLNAQYRDKDESTDVLSFSLGETAPRGRYLPGDIVISLETLGKNAAYFEVPEDEELRRLLVHGILHLSGMDHTTNDPAEPMLALQEQLLAEFAGERILPQTGITTAGEKPAGIQSAVRAGCL
jgi:probable rRNA maturation factor